MAFLLRTQLIAIQVSGTQQQQFFLDLFNQRLQIQVRMARSNIDTKLVQITDLLMMFF